MAYWDLAVKGIETAWNVAHTDLAVYSEENGAY
jgi:hypothetical protein